MQSFKLPAHLLSGAMPACPRCASPRAPAGVSAQRTPSRIAPAGLPPGQIKEQEEVLRQDLADMRAKEAERGADIPTLIQERDECRCVRHAGAPPAVTSRPALLPPRVSKRVSQKAQNGLSS